MQLILGLILGAILGVVADPVPPHNTVTLYNSLVTIGGIADMWVECDGGKRDKMQRYKMPVEKFEELLKTGRL